jgi:ATP-dependent RNA helicase HelY
VAWRWAGGAELDDALAGEALPAGDFVRTTKQVADLLRQIRDVGTGGLRDTAAVAARSLVRGVVAHTGL